jgi:acetyltransferase
MAFVATLGAIGFERIIGVGRYAAEPDLPGMVEVAYTIHDDYHGLGLGTLLQKHLEDYARRKGFAGVSGYLFRDNAPMLKLFARGGTFRQESLEDGLIRVWRLFEQPSPDKP